MNIRFLVILLIILLLFTIPVTVYLFSQNLDNRQPTKEYSAKTRIKEDLKTMLRAKTIDLLISNNKYIVSNQEEKKIYLNKLKQLSSERKKILITLMEQDPKEAEKMSIPEDLKNQFPTQIQSDLEKKTTVEGEFNILHVDSTKDKNSKNIYILQNDQANLYYIYFTDNLPITVPGSIIKVTGLQLDNSLLVTDETSNISLKQTAKKVKGVSTIKTLAVVLLNFLDDTRTPSSPLQVKNDIFLKGRFSYNNPTSTQSYYQEASYGRLKFEGIKDTDGDVFGWYTTPFTNPSNQAECQQSLFKWVNYSKEKLLTENVDLNMYDKVLIVFPFSSGCPFTGAAYIGGKYAWINGDYTYGASTVGHELGHTLGLVHANAYNCSENGKRVSLSSSEHCESIEYGDSADIMGSTDYHFNSYYKTKLGFLDPNNTQTVTQNGIYTIEQLGVPTNGIKALKIKQDNKYYLYLEYRGSYGIWDNFKAIKNFILLSEGVLIRLAPDITDPENLNTQLIDTTPETFNLWNTIDAALKVGKTFKDPINGVVVRPLNIGNGKAIVKIEFTNIPCIHSKPEVTITPLSQWAKPGTQLIYKYTVKNTDSVSCKSSIFEFSSKLGGSSFISSTPTFLTFALRPGETKTLNVAVVSDKYSLESLNSFEYVISNRAEENLYTIIGGNYNIYTTSNPAINTGSVLQSYTPWKIQLNGINFTYGIRAKVFEINNGVDQLWKDNIATSVANNNQAVFSLPANSPPSLCNIQNTCTIKVQLIDTTKNLSSNVFDLELPVNTASINTPTPTLDVPTPTNTKPTPSVTIPPQKDTTPPNITIKYPSNGTVLPNSSGVNIDAQASDASGISSLKIYIDTQLVKTCGPAAPSSYCKYFWSLPSVLKGNHVIKFIASDKAVPSNISISTVTVVKN